MIRDMAAEDGLPDYALAFGDDDVLVVRARRRLPAAEGEAPRISAEIHERARIIAPGYDVHWLEAEWLRHWRASGKPVLRDAEAAFLAFARARAERAPQR